MQAGSPDPSGAPSLLDPLAQPSQGAPDKAGHTWRRMVCGHCGAERDIAVYCGDRFCPVCSVAKRARARARLDHLVKHRPRIVGTDLRFITLTIPNTPDVEAGVLTCLRAFRRLRARRGWKNYVEGGVFVIEVTGRPNNWHAHLHIIAQGTYLPVRLLSAMWQAVSPGKIVWIQRTPPQTAIHYVTKYLSKCALPDFLRHEVGLALKRFRLFQPFGCWHGLKLPPLRVNRACRKCGHTAWIPAYLLTADMDRYNMWLASHQLKPDLEPTSSDHAGRPPPPSAPF